MIIRIIATALIQCTTRTQAGWITFAGTAAVRCSLAVMLDMAVPPEFAPDYTPKTPFRYGVKDHQVDFTTPSFRGVANDTRKARAVGDEPGIQRCCLLPDSGFARCASAPEGRHKLAYDAGISTVSTTWITPVRRAR